MSEEVEQNSSKSSVDTERRPSEIVYLPSVLSVMTHGAVGATPVVQVTRPELGKSGA